LTAARDFTRDPVSRLQSEVTISAVQYDSRLVTEVTERLAPLLGTVPRWRGHDSDVVGAHKMLSESGLVLVMHQRLWGHDEITASDAIELRERIRGAKSLPVTVVAVDTESVPDWLSRTMRIETRTAGADEIVARLAEMMEPRRKQRPAPAPEVEPLPHHRWNAPAAFLSQPRSLSAFRHAFDDLADELNRHVSAERERRSDRHSDLRCSPNRLVVQLGDVGLSFSWLAGRSGAVADGRLMVIEWQGTIVQSRGGEKLNAPSPGRERVFQAEATGPDNWCWRAADAGSGAYSSRDLAGQAFAGALLTLQT
jgi:hypothetical protein